jgi:hypothetical protein
MLTTEAKDWVKELSMFLTADVWSQQRIEELLINVWLDGYKEKEKEINND